MRQTLLHIRNYAEVIHPVQFKDGTVLGWKIRLLNRIRYRLEVWVQELVLISQCRTAKLSLRERIETFRRFKEENQAEIEWMERNESQAATSALMDDGLHHDGGRQPQPRLVLDITPRSTKRPVSLNNLIQTYGGGVPTPRYRRPTSNVDNFEPVGGNNDGEFVS